MPVAVLYSVMRGLGIIWFAESSFFHCLSSPVGPAEGNTAHFVSSFHLFARCMLSEFALPGDSTCLVGGRGRSGRNLGPQDPLRTFPSFPFRSKSTLLPRRGGTAGTTAQNSAREWPVTGTVVLLSGEGERSRGSERRQSSYILRGGRHHSRSSYRSSHRDCGPLAWCKHLPGHGFPVQSIRPSMIMGNEQAVRIFMVRCCKAVYLPVGIPIPMAARG